MTDITHVETKKTNLEINREAFLAKLDDIDRANIEAIRRDFEQILRNRGISGSLLAVGGALTKPLPRKDIDIVVVVGSSKSMTEYKDRLEYANEKFRELTEITGQIIAENRGLRLTESLGPAIDEEFGTPSILKHNGTVKLEKNGATPVDLINTFEKSPDEVIKRQESPYCVISRI